MVRGLPATVDAGALEESVDAEVSVGATVVTAGAAVSLPPPSWEIAKSAITRTGMPTPKISPRLVSLLRCCFRMRS